jgi:Phosphotransferase enzyme family
MSLFLLSSQNIYTYLSESKLFNEGDFDPTKIELKHAKNFNLLLTFRNGKKLLVKQERHYKSGGTAGEFLNDWSVQELIGHFPELISVRYLFPKILHFDAEHSIIAFDYLVNYRDLDELYSKERIFPVEIATNIGSAIASIHSLTLENENCQIFLASSRQMRDESEKENPVYLYGIERISPDVFSLFPSDGLRFLSLYQRYESLGDAILALKDTYQPCCLIHQDFKLNNILLHNDWEQRISKSQPDDVLRFIDWERSGWGDPASDLGSIIASYLQIWLGSLIVSSDTTLEESLRMAITPLELLQPSLNALMIAYLKSFPEILHHQPTFVQRSVQFAGLALIQQIHAMIQYQKVFNNTGICMLQVAKSFICRPEQSISTVFGQSESELIDASKSELVSA